MAKSPIFYEFEGRKYRIPCGDYSCNRDATQVPVGLVIREYEGDNYTAEDIEDARREQAARAVRCNVHVGAEKRRTWGQPANYEPLANRADVRLLALGHRHRIALAVEADNQKKANEARVKAEARFAEEWAGWGEDTYVIQNDNSEYRRENAGVRNVKVIGDGTNPNSWNVWEVSTEQSTRYDDLPLPVYVRISRTGSMSPNEARALAKALNLMADRVDAANSLIRQNFEA